MEEKLLEEWQERLGLQDWLIVLRYNCEFDDLELDDASGETNWNDTIKTGTIRIISEKVYGYDRIVPFDFEQILVHELLHIKLGLLSFTNNTYESKVNAELRHQLIDDLARALVMAKRGETKRQLAKDCKKARDINEYNKCSNCSTQNLLIDKIVEQSKKQMEELEENGIC